MSAETLQAYAERELTKVGRFEWAGRCPFCGDETHFHVSFKMTPHGACHCYVGGADCPGGDREWWRGPWFTHKLYGVSYPDALKMYGVEAGKPTPKVDPAEWQAAKAEEIEKALALSLQTWSPQAAQVLAKFQRGLYSPEAAAYLKGERHLTGATCQALGFGYCTKFESMPAWGGVEEKYFFPEGVVMPIQRGGQTIGMVVRREKVWIAPDGRKVRFRDVFGGPKIPFLCGPAGGIVVVTEGILDAASIYQATRGTIGVMAVCGNDMPLDKAARDMLAGAKAVLIAADADSAGAKLAPIVRAVRPMATTASVPNGKDPNGYLVARGDDALAEWVIDMAGRALDNEKAQPMRGQAGGVANSVASVAKNHSVATHEEKGVVPSPSPSLPPANKNLQARAEEILAPLLGSSANRIDGPAELDGMQPLTDITTPGTVKRVTCETPLACVLSFYASVRLLAYPDGRVIVRDPMRRDGLLKYVAAYQARIWKEMTGGAADRALSLHAA